MIVTGLQRRRLRDPPNRPTIRIKYKRVGSNRKADGNAEDWEGTGGTSYAQRKWVVRVQLNSINPERMGGMEDPSRNCRSQGRQVSKRHNKTRYHEWTSPG